jgi:hypothetical protein
MTVETRHFKDALVDENFNKDIDYKLLADCVHAELGDRKHL